MPYSGRLPVRHLTSKRIRPIEHRSWNSARRYFQDRPKHWAGVEKYLDEIRRGGLREPILIAQSKRHPADFYVGDGHHRAVALLEAGARDFPFHWYVIPDFGKPRMSADPFPFDLLA